MRVLALGLQFQRGFVLQNGFLGSLLNLVQAAEPFMYPPRRREPVANWGALQIFAGQTLRLLVMLFFDHPGHAPVKLPSRVEASKLFALLRPDNRALPL